MAFAHRNTDVRDCGALTTVIGQSFVTVAGQLWAVQGDTNTHGDGQLIASQSYVTINGIPVIRVGDPASPDDLCLSIGGDHCDPIATGSASFVNVA